MDKINLHIHERHLLQWGPDVHILLIEQQTSKTENKIYANVELFTKVIMLECECVCDRKHTHIHTHTHTHTDVSQAINSE